MNRGDNNFHLFNIFNTRLKVIIRNSHSILPAILFVVRMDDSPMASHQLDPYNKNTTIILQVYFNIIIVFS